jgi:regulator of sigma E protease
MGMYILADITWWLNLGNWLSILKAAGGLGFVIFVHELGHFLVAKACGVKCEKFYVGFDPPLKYLPSALFKRQWGETEYGIGIIPLGGYVKMLGQDDNPANAAREAERVRVAKEQQATGESVEVVDEEFVLDPRSYPAKSVPQRMAIISAGVIMNLIFAVIFATIAYLMGVNYVPCAIGRTVPGDPAWQAGIKPGDEIVQLGRDGEPDYQLNFTRDLRFSVAATGNGNDLEMLVQHPDKTQDWITVQPSTTLKQQIGLPTIGITSAMTNQVDIPSIGEMLSQKILGAAVPEEADSTRLANGDIINSVQVGTESEKVELDEQTGGYKLQRILTRYPDQDLTLQVSRPEEDDKSGLPPTRAVTLKPQPMQELGLSMKPGAVVALRNDSPAEKAGIQIGDVITAVAGEAVTEPLNIDSLFLERIGEQTEISVLRRASGDISQHTLTVTPEPPAGDGSPTYEGGPLAAETIGVAMEVSNEVQHVNESLAEKILPGDKIEKATFVVAQDAEITAQQLVDLGLARALTFGEDARNSWSDLMYKIQNVPAGVEVHLTVLRDKKQEIVVVEPSAAYAWFSSDRDIIFKGLNRTRTASTIGNAVDLGVGETWAGIEQVIFTLRHIGEYFQHLGGPGTIAVVATSEASQGIPRLLTFLTLLSANLAVINFLPIPVLDGGHMMFLLAEGIRGKPVNERWAFYLTMIGLSFILALMVFVIGMDVYRFTGLAG